MPGGAARVRPDCDGRMVEESGKGTDGRGDDAATERMLAQIREIVLQARTTWFTLLFLLTFAGITLLGVEHADFFVSETRQTTLPLLNVRLPIETFYAFAPLLIVAFYIYLHLQLIQLWERIDPNRLPAIFAGAAIGRSVYPGLLTDFALRARGDESVEHHTLASVSILVVFLLVWLFAPAILYFFWWKSIPTGLSLSLYLGFIVFLAVYVGMTSLQCLFRISFRPLLKKFNKYVLGIFLILQLFAVVSFSLSVRFESLRETLGIGRLIGKLDLAGVELIPKPDSWMSYDVAKENFKIDWCQERDLSNCSNFEIYKRFEFVEDWWRDRGLHVEQLQSINLQGSILGGGNLREIFAPGADFSFARLEGADLRDAQLERANFRGARLEGAFLFETRLQGADLVEARLDGADLFGARLEGADLREARLEGANLREARLERADLLEARLEEAQLQGAFLFGARLEGADLREARLERANLLEARLEEARLQGAFLFGARLEGAVLRWARLEGADLREARLEGAVLSAADFTGTTLNQGQIDGAIGDADTVLPRDAETGAQLYVWSCWEQPPPTLDRTLALYPESQHQELRDRWLCNGRAREQVVRPAPEAKDAPKNGGSAPAAPAP